MRSIEELEPEKFGCFYFSELTGDISLFLLSPDGDIEYFGYEAFSSDSGTVIAFNSFNPQSTDYAYLLKCGDNEEIIQFQLYENLLEILNNNDNKENAFYAMFGSKSVLARVEEGEHVFVPVEEHCDKHIYGAAPFFELQDGVSETLLDFSKFNFSNITEIFPVLSVQGEACILRITMKEEDGSYRQYPAVTAIAKTLAGLLRMACEWRMITKEPFNNTEFPALKITSFLDTLEIIGEVETELLESNPSMHVEKFITDPQNCRNIIEENGNIPERLKNLIKKKVRYSTLKSLSENTAFNISSDVLEQEKLLVESAIYSFSVLNNIPYKTLDTASDFLDYLKTINYSNPENIHLDIRQYLQKIGSL